MVIPEESSRWDFFVSYTEADKAWAEWIAWQLETEAGFKVLIQAWDLVPGAHSMTQMGVGIRGSDRTLAVLSHAYLHSVYEQAEWQAAYRHDPGGVARKLIPIRIEECPHPGLLDGVVSFDLFGLSVDQARARLFTNIQSALKGRGKPDSEPIFPGQIVPPAHSTRQHPRPQQSLTGRKPFFPGTSAPVEPEAAPSVEQGSRWWPTAHRKGIAAAAVGAVLIGAGGYQMFHQPAGQPSQAQTTPTMSATPDRTSSPSPAPLTIGLSVSPRSGSSSAIFTVSGSCPEVGGQVDIEWDDNLGTLYPAPTCTDTHHYSQPYSPKNGQLDWDTPAGDVTYIKVTPGPHQIKAYDAIHHQYTSDAVSYTVS